MNKDGTPGASLSGRRTSVTQAQNASAYGTNSPSARPVTRRRESSDFVQDQVASPTGNSRFQRDDNIVATPPSLLRRRTDKESFSGPSLEEKGDSRTTDNNNPFGALKRTTTGPVSSGFNGPSSPWSNAPQSAGFSPMGAFGNFSLGGTAGQTPTSGEKKTTFGGVRGESRFKDLMSADSSEEIRSKVKEKASISSLERLAESSDEPSTLDWSNVRSGRKTDLTSHREDDLHPTGSAALGGDDASPPRPTPSRYTDLNRQVSHDEIGFSPLGISSDLPSFRDLLQKREMAQQAPYTQPQGRQTLEPMSPTNTNPYQSPEAEKAIPDNFENDDSDYPLPHLPATSNFGHPARGVPSQLDGTASDQSRTSSAGASRGFPNLGPLGGFNSLSGSTQWSGGPNAVGIPSRTLPGSSAGFGDPIFGGLGDLYSPGHGLASGSGMFGGAGGSGAVSRGSKLGPLFAHQEQMQEQLSGDTSEFQHRGGNLQGQTTSLRETESSSRPGRGMLDDLFGNLDLRNRGGHAMSSPYAPEGSQAVTGQPSQVSAAVRTPLTNAPGSSYFPKPQEQDSQVSNQIPASQQKQMVMPDRMRWIYRDPQGNTQGPWSGLEMHDWYKAGFFSPELQVKKLEEADYEPLAQLIRRIGNSREPFLVPQIGIPHGSSTGLTNTGAQASGAASAATPSAAQSSAQPPFANSFPSFGTTLTAEQQNALERRKQEEQYLMARQKEHLAQQQVLIKQMQHMQGGPHGMHGQQLHHHSSAHSLQSQPSYGSITSPIGYQPSPAQGPIQPPSAMSGFFDSGRSNIPNLGGMSAGNEPLPPLREDDLSGLMERLNAQRTAPLSYGGAPHGAPQDDPMHQRQVQYMLMERHRLQREQEQQDMIQRAHEDSRETAERLEQFSYLRSQTDDQQHFQQPMNLGGGIQRSNNEQGRAPDYQRDDTAGFGSQVESEPIIKGREALSLSEQVQKAVKESPAVQPQSPWAKVESGLPQPFPPPQSGSPLPAPAAQRNRQNVADALNAESQSSSHTPSIDTPSATIAPWAKENNESSKGPSLKEIQEIEARKAAHQEEIAAAARRALAEQERLNQPQQITPAPGLPSSANWANSISPATTTAPSAPSAWAKSSASKTAVATPVTGAKKTLAQIQKEEEARKSRATASATASATNSSTNTATVGGGKRYADLAGKVPLANMSQAPINQAWTTVGAGGKLKPPLAPAATPTAKVLTAGTTPQIAAPVAPKTKIAGKTLDKQGASEELQKWARGWLSKGLNSGIPGNDPQPILTLSYCQPFDPAILF